MNQIKPQTSKVQHYNDNYNDYLIIRSEITQNYALFECDFSRIDTLEFPSIDGLIAYYENLTSDQYDENFNSTSIDTQI
jgi:hypothetical protein